MGFKIQPSKLGAGPAAPDVFPLVPEATQTFEKGTPIKVVSGEAEEHPLVADVTNLYGFSLEGVATGVSENPSGDVHTAKANRRTEFVSKAYSTGAIQEDLSAVNIGDQYGLLKVGTDFYVDLDDAVNVLVQITKIHNDTTGSGLGSVLWWKVLESALQEP